MVTCPVRSGLFLFVRLFVACFTCFDFVFAFAYVPYKLSFLKNIYTLTTLFTNLKLHSYCFLTAWFFFRNYVYIITILDKSQITCLFFYFLIYLLVPKLSTHNFTAYNNTLDVLETTNKAQLSNQTDIDWKKSAHSLCLIWRFGYVWLLFSSNPRTYRYWKPYWRVWLSLHFCCH